MLTIHKSRLASLTTLTGLSIFSAGNALADGEIGDTAAIDAGNYRTEEHAGRMTCSEALQLAWLKRQVEFTDGNPMADASPAPAPAECLRDIVATGDIG
jgi:hypothetical protein